MDYKKELVSKLKSLIRLKEENIYNDEIEIQPMSFNQLRDKLIGKGTILDEDFEKQIYTINVMSGFANQNTAIIAIKLTGNKLELAGYAREGIIKQNTVEKAVEVLKNIF
jgi:hypothetical protein